MKSVLGSGGRTNVSTSWSAAAISETLRAAPKSRSASAAVMPADQVLGQRLRVEPREAVAHFVADGPADRVGRGDRLDHLAAGFVAGGQRFGEQVVDVVDLRAALAQHLRRTRRARVAPAPPRARRRRADRRGWRGSVAADSGPVGGRCTLRSLPTSEWTPNAAISSRSLFTAWPIAQRRLGNSMTASASQWRGLERSACGTMRATHLGSF